MPHFVGNITPEDKALYASYRADPTFKKWIVGIHPNTRHNYDHTLCKVLKELNLTPTQLKERAESNPKELSIDAKAILRNHDRSEQYRRTMRAAFKNFLAFYELDVPLTGLKIHVKRKVKPFFPWDQAMRVIGLASREYAPIYEFMLWAAFDLERFVKLNGDKERLAKITKQLEDKEKQWVKIDVPEGRKSSDPFYCLVPRKIAGLLPILDQDGQPMIKKAPIFWQWHQAMMRAGLADYGEFGPHNLRSAWLDEATKRELDPVIRQHQLGHKVDALGYQRIQQDVSWVEQHFAQAWKIKPVATKEELAQRDKKIAELEGVKGVTLQLLEEDIQELDEQIKTRESVTGEAAKLLVKPELEALRAKRDTRLKQLAALQGTPKADDQTITSARQLRPLRKPQS